MSRFAGEGCWSRVLDVTGSGGHGFWRSRVLEVTGSTRSRVLQALLQVTFFSEVDGFCFTGYRSSSSSCTLV